MLLKQKICSHSRKKASTFHKHVSSLERTMYFLQRRSDQGDDIASLLVDTKAELEKTLLYKAQKCHICSNGRTTAKPLLNIFPTLRRSVVNRDYSLLLRPLGGGGGTSCFFFDAYCSHVVLFFVPLFTADTLNASEQTFFS